MAETEKPSDAELVRASSRVREAVAQLNIAITGAASMGLRVEIVTEVVPEIGREWPVPVVRSHVSQPL